MAASGFGPEPHPSESRPDLKNQEGLLSSSARGGRGPPSPLRSAGTRSRVGPPGARAPFGPGLPRGGPSCLTPWQAGTPSAACLGARGALRTEPSRPASAPPAAPWLEILFLRRPSLNRRQRVVCACSSARGFAHVAVTRRGARLDPLLSRSPPASLVSLRPLPAVARRRPHPRRRGEGRDSGPERFSAA